MRDILDDETRSGIPAVMIGDRDTDFIAASALGIPSIAVKWGYGSEIELKMASVIVETPQALLAAVRRIAQQAGDIKPEGLRSSS